MAEVGPSVLYVAQVSGPRPDPAYNLTAEGYLAALETYAKTRRQEDLAKIPLKPGRTPRLYAVQLMDPETFAALSTLQNGVGRLHFAVALTVHAASVDGQTHVASMRAKEKLPIAETEWLTKLARWGGEYLLAELADVAETRATLGDWTPEADDPLELYAPPRGMARAPSPKS